VTVSTRSPAGQRRPAVRAAVGAVTTTVVSVMPVFLVGGLAVQISQDLHLNPAGLGLAVSVYFGVTALGSLPIGGLVERFGPARTGRTAVLLSGGGMLAIALGARTLPTLVALLAAAATANSLGQLSSNASLARAVPRHRQGLTFGAKQSAIPLSTLLAGAAVPAVALTLGWRWAFAIGCAMAVAALALVPPDQPDTRTPQQRRRGRVGAGLALLGVAAALAAGTASALSAFLVDAAVARGRSEASAGLLLTLGSGLCVVFRLMMGWFADRLSRGHLGLVAASLAAGAVGAGLLTLDSPAALLPGVLLGFGLGWCWPGLLAFAVVRLRPRTPAAATSVTQTGVYAGGSIGPLGFGLVAGHAGYPVAWGAASVSAALACGLVVVGAALAVREPG
jgi:MFS family permease